jgi:alpha-galactosidase
MNMTNAMMQRMHLSGDVFNWDDATKDLVKEAIEVYKATRKDIASAIPFYPLGDIPSYDDKWLCTGYKCTDCTRLIVWRLDSDNDSITIPVDFAERVEILYPSVNNYSLTLDGANIHLTLPEKNTAVFIELKA